MSSHLGKRKADAMNKTDEELFIPKGCKEWNGKVVFKNNKILSFVKTPIEKVWFNSMEDDADEAKTSVYINTKSLDPDDLEYVKSIDKLLETSAKKLSRQHCALINDKDQLKLQTYQKLTKRRKTAVLAGSFCLTGDFLLSSIYDYMDKYYGVNFIVPRNKKKVQMTQVAKVVKDEEKEDGEVVV